MLRFTRPLFQAARKTTTGLTGLSVHPDPLPALQRTYEETLSALAALPATSVYRQGTEALTRRRLGVVQQASGDVAAVEKAIDEGQIEEVLVGAEDELKLVGKMAEWKPLSDLTLSLFCKYLISVLCPQVGTARGEASARAVGVLWFEDVRHQPHPAPMSSCS
jgi:NADH dehydrogenase (ubiquinone) 1 alpha subcomplex subunit 5